MKNRTSNNQKAKTNEGLSLGEICTGKPLSLTAQVKALNGTRGRGSYFVRVKHDREWNEIVLKLTDGTCTRSEYRIDIGHTKESKADALGELTQMIKHFIAI